MNLIRVKESQDHQHPGSEEDAVADLVVDEESDAFKFVQDAHATGKRVDLTNMTDQDLEEYVARQA